MGFESLWLSWMAAFGNAAYSDGPVLGHLGAPQTVAQRITAGGQTKRKNRHRAQEDGAAVLQLLDHCFDTLRSSAY